MSRRQRGTERDKQSEEIAGGRRGSKRLIWGKCAVLSTQINYIDVDDSVTFHTLPEKISIYFNYRYTAQFNIWFCSFYFQFESDIVTIAIQVYIYIIVKL